MYKAGKYEGLAADVRDDEYSARFCAVEVWRRGLVYKSMYDALKQLIYHSHNVTLYLLEITVSRSTAAQRHEIYVPRQEAEENVLSQQPTTCL